MSFDRVRQRNCLNCQTRRTNPCVVRLAALMMLITLGACSSDTLVCASPPTSAIRLSIADSVTRVVSNSNTDVLWSVSGSAIDTLHLGTLEPQFETGRIDVGTDAGVYSITVRRGGYQEWTRSNIRVGVADCGGPSTVELTAYLRKF